jgi:hypothetical protein
MTDINNIQYEQYLNFKKQLLNKSIVSDFKEFDAVLLLRFLRARKFDLDASTKMFQDYLAWRKKQNIELIMQTKFSQEKQIQSFYPRGYHKTDKLGRPIYFELISRVDYDKVNSLISDDDLIRLTIRDYENYINFKMPSCSKVAGRPIEQSLSILCAKDVSLSFTMKVINF